MQTTEQRVERLEKHNRRLTVVAMCAVLTVAVTGEKHGVFDSVVARDIYVANAEGR